VKTFAMQRKPKQGMVQGVRGGGPVLTDNSVLLVLQNKASFSVIEELIRKFYL